MQRGAESLSSLSIALLFSAPGQEFDADGPERTVGPVRQDPAHSRHGRSEKEDQDH